MDLPGRRKITFIFAVIFYITMLSNLLARDLIVSWDANSEADLMGYKIYYGTSSRAYSTIIELGKVTTHKVSGLTEGVPYFFAVTAFDSSRNESDFSEEVSATIPVEDFIPPTIYSAALVSATSLDLTFSEKVEKSSAENKANYQINNGINISSISLDPNQQTVHIITTVHQVGTYAITVNHVRDLAPNQNLIAPNSSYTYQYVPDDTEPPILTNVLILDGTHVDVVFSESIEKKSSETIQNYRIDKGITINQAGLDQDNRTIHLVTSAHQSGTTYTLTVNNISDRAPRPNYIATNSSKQYTYYETDLTPPVIYSVNIRNHNLVDVMFSEQVEQQSAENIQNYQINNGTNVLAAMLDINLKTVHLSTTTHQANITYTITVNNITDRSQTTNKIKANSTYNYIYQPDDRIPPQILSAVAIDGTHVEAEFSEALDRESAEQENHYLISNGISIIEAKLDNDPKKVHLTTTAHQSGKNYTIIVSDIKDLAPNPNVIVANSSVQYTYIYQDKEAPRIENAQIVYATYLKVLFNEIIERESAEDAANYAISGGPKVVSAILDNNLKLVHLTTSEHQPNRNYTLTVKNIRDRAAVPNVIASNTTVNYSFVVDSNSVVVGLNKDNYQLAYLNAGDKYYIDREYVITKIPEEMKGYLWIKTANDDRDKKDENFLTFQLEETTKVYIAYDSRAINYPNWLVNHFHRIGKYIGVNEHAQKLDLWEMESMSTVITLGGNLAAGAQGAESMYIVLIQSKNSERPVPPDDMQDPLSAGTNIFLLYQNCPNPFNAGTEIRFQLPQNSFVELKIYNILGQTVQTLAQGYKTAGSHLLTWDGRNEQGMSLPSGVYFSKLIIKKTEEKDGNKRVLIILNNVRKMIMIK